MKKGVEFTMHVEEITDYDEFNSKEKLIEELKEFIKKLIMMLKLVLMIEIF